MPYAQTGPLPFSIKGVPVLQKKIRFRSALFFGASAAALLSLGTAAMAQQQVETVTITGSRIPVSANVQAPTAVTTVSEEVMQMSGTVNVADILRGVPSFGVSGLTPTNSNFLTQGAGISTLELRNLGEDRTLVLVNGRRYVSGSAGNSYVDFNTIPTDMVERVEVITGGSSAIYGSDALAGVINVILKQDFEGITGNVQYGSSDHGDDLTYKTSATIGGNFGNNKGNAFLNIAWSRNEGVRSADRSNTATDSSVSSACDSDTAAHLQQCFVPTYGTYSSYSAYGRFAIPSTGKAYTLSTGTGATGTVVPFSTATYGFNRQAYRNIEVPVDRLLVAGQAHYNFTDTFQIYTEATFASTEAKQQSEPFAFDSTTNLGKDANGDTLGISIDNPFVPAALRNAAIAAGDSKIDFRRRMVEIGPRNYTADRDLYRIVVGSKGTLLNDYHWDAYFDWGHTLDTQQGSGQVNVPNMREALNARAATAADVAAGASIGGAPASVGDIICGNAYSWGEGCAPLNLFGLNSMSKAAVNYIQAPQSRIDNIDQQVIGASIAGPIPYVVLPAGKIQLVGGFEYRREFASDIPDALTQSGQNAGNKELPIRGSYHVLEFFTEFEAPILKDLPLVKELTVGGAWRWSQYNTQGVTNAYTGRVSWSPLEELRFRGQYAHAVRAPNITELYAPGGENFAPVTDPCNGITATTTGTIAANCRSIPAIAGRIAATGSFTLDLAEQQGTGGFTGKGNTGLRPEQADTWSLGAVWQHDFSQIGNLTFSADWYKIKVNRYITTVARQQALDQCYNGASYPNSFCNLLVRDTSGPAFQQGELKQVNSGYVNEGWARTSGLDISMLYSTDLNDFVSLNAIGVGDAGQLAWRTSWAWLLDWNQEAYGQLSPQKGSVGYPNHKIQTAFLYQNGPVNVQWQMNIISSARISGDPASDPFYLTKVGSYWTHDVSLSYDITENFQGYFGINNLFDLKAPNILSGVPGNTTGTNTAADVYDAIGRRYFFGARVKF